MPPTRTIRIPEFELKGASSNPGIYWVDKLPFNCLAVFWHFLAVTQSEKKLKRITEEETMSLKHSLIQGMLQVMVVGRCLQEGCKTSEGIVLWVTGKCVKSGRKTHPFENPERCLACLKGFPEKSEPSKPVVLRTRKPLWDV